MPPSLSLKDILGRLGPLTPNPYIGIAIYLIVGLTLITMFLQKKSSTTISLMLSAVIMCALIDKVGVPGFLSPRNFGVYIMRIVMFTFPLVVAGMTKWEKSRMPAISAGMLSGAYLFLRWFFEMRA